MELDKLVVTEQLYDWECKLIEARGGVSWARKQVAFYSRLLKEIEDGVPTKEDVARQEPAKLSKRK